MGNKKMEMSEELVRYQVHQHVTDAVARSALKCVANHLNNDYEKVVRKFVNQDYEVTVEFWKFLEEQCPDIYGGVDFCECCNSFTLYKKEGNFFGNEYYCIHTVVPPKGFLHF